MLKRIVVATVILVFLLAQGPQAYSTAKGWLGLDDWSWRTTDPLTAPERAKELGEKGLREQIISFHEGMIALEYKYNARPETQRYDIYAIGVGQVTLGDPEANDRYESVVVTGSRIPPREQPDASTVPTEPITGEFNNVLIFDRRNGSFSKLFDKRLAVSKFQYGWRTKTEVLIAFATETDSNRDGKLDDRDLQDIYIYTFVDKQLHKIAAKGISPQEIVDLPDVDYIVVRARRDRDGDGDPSSNGDPSVLIRIDLKTMTAASFVPEELIRDLQKTLDGK